MEKINLNEYLAANEYPGRGIAVAKAPDGRQMFIGYFIMGRSENSRNRVFDPVPERGGICTMAADPAKLEDPSLIIYNPVLTLGKTHIVTNGDQTDTIFDEMSRGKSFADALRTRTFEPDEPNYTPRISAVVYADGSYQMSILKSADGNGESLLVSSPLYSDCCHAVKNMPSLSVTYFTLGCVSPASLQVTRFTLFTCPLSIT